MHNQIQSSLKDWGLNIAMRLLLCVCLLSLCCLATCKPAKNVNRYTTKYDYIDVDQILKSHRLLKNYMDCVMERGPCTREGLELRKHIPDALQTECSKCSEKQKEIAGKVMGYLLQYRKPYWEQLLAKYDPDGTFRKKYEVEDFGEDYSY